MIPVPLWLIYVVPLALFVFGCWLGAAMESAAAHRWKKQAQECEQRNSELYDRDSQMAAVARALVYETKTLDLAGAPEEGAHE